VLVVLRIFYGQGSPYLELGYLFPSLAVFTVAMIATELIICYFLGIGKTRLALKINLLGVAVVAIVAAPLFTTLGPLSGACLALAVGDTARLAATFFSLRQLIGSEKQLISPPPPEASQIHAPSPELQLADGVLWRGRLRSTSSKLLLWRGVFQQTASVALVQNSACRTKRQDDADF
jgi:hypothetical protein